MKKILVPCADAAMLCRKKNLVKENLRLSEPEALLLLDLALSSMAKRLEEAKRIYREQRQELDKLKQAQLWKFKTPSSVPPDFKAEYLRRLNAGEVNVEISPGTLTPLKVLLLKSHS